MRVLLDSYVACYAASYDLLESYHKSLFITFCYPNLWFCDHHAKGKLNGKPFLSRPVSSSARAFHQSLTDYGCSVYDDFSNHNNSTSNVTDYSLKLEYVEKLEV